MDRSYRRDAKSRISGIQNEHKRNNDGSRWSEDFSYEQSSAYGQAQRAIRGSYGMIDGLKVTKAEFDRLLRERRAADEKARPGRSRSGWVGMSGRQVKQGECRVVQAAVREEMTLEQALEKRRDLQSIYDAKNPAHVAEYRTINNRIRQLQKAQGWS